MRIKNWVDERFQVSIVLLAALGNLVTTEGLVTRAFGMSDGAAALFGDIDSKTLMHHFKQNALDVEPIILDTMQDFAAQNPKVRRDYAKHPERYFPGVDVEIDLDDISGERRTVQLGVAYNAVPNGKGGKDAFIAFLHPAEVEDYRIERVKAHDQR